MIKKSLPFFLLLFAIGNYFLWLKMFHAENQLLAKGMCCGFTSPIFDQIAIWYGDAYWIHGPRPFELNKGYTAFVGAWLFEQFDREASALLYISQTAILLSMLLLQGLGSWWKDHFFGAFLALVFPMIPIIAYTGLRWDIYSLQLPVIIFAFWVAISSKGFSRIPHCVLYAGLGFVAAFWSSRETDNFILLLSLAAIAFGSWLQCLIRGKDILGRKVIRWQSACIGIGTCAFVIFTIYQSVHFTSPEGLSYYFSEADRNVGLRRVDPTSWVYRSSYWGYLYWRGLGPYIAGTFLVAVSYLLILRKFPMALLFGIFIPLFLLSWVTKRNYYYTSIIWPLIPIVIVVFASELPKRISWLAYGVIFLVCFPHFWLRLDSTNIMTRFADQKLVFSTPTYGGIFQTSDGGMSLRPTSNQWAVIASEKIASVITRDACKDQKWGITYTQLPIEEVSVRLKKDHPCLIFKNFAPLQKLEEASLVLFDSNHMAQFHKEILLKWSFEHRTYIRGPNEHLIEVWTKGD
jgi:hypothetical protein